MQCPCHDVAKALMDQSAYNLAIKVVTGGKGPQMTKCEDEHLSSEEWKHTEHKTRELSDQQISNVITFLIEFEHITECRDHK